MDWEPAETLVRLRPRVESEIGVTVSVGLSDCKFLAKLASDLDKPRGFVLLRREEAKAWLAPQSVGRLWGVGKAGQGRLERLGFRLIGDLQRIDEWTAASRLGEDGRRLWRARAGDRRPPRQSRPRDQKHFERDDVRVRCRRTTRSSRACLLGHCDRVAARLRKEGLAAGGVTLKLRLPDFSLRTRSRTGMRPTQLAPASVRRRARRCSTLSPRGIAYRLLGVAATDLAPAAGADEDDLIDREHGARKSREAAIASLRDKFGAGPFSAALPFGNPRARHDPRYLLQAGVGRISSF